MLKLLISASSWLTPIWPAPLALTYLFEPEAAIKYELDRLDFGSDTDFDPSYFKASLIPASAVDTATRLALEYTQASLYLLFQVQMILGPSTLVLRG